MEEIQKIEINFVGNKNYFLFDKFPKFHDVGQKEKEIQR